MKMCNKCGAELIIDRNWSEVCKKHSMYLCRECSIKISEKYDRSHGVRSMSENKSCASYLGCHIAERVLKHVFKDVEVMPYGYSGYDFICNKGKKIDVKSSCARYNTCYTKYWQFRINENQIADYFLCLAFDNRNDLNPLHMWLLPSSIVNHRCSVSICETTITKWDEYRIDVTKVTECCDKIKKTKEE